MEIRRVSVEKLNPAAYNPRKDLKPGDSEYKKLARSLNHFGYVEPIVWNERTGNVIGGHQRLKVLIAEGAKEIEVSVVNLTINDEKALNVALNKVSGDWDADRLPELLQELLQQAEIDETLTGFDTEEIDGLLSAVTQSCDAYLDSFFENNAPPRPERKERQTEASNPVPAEPDRKADAEEPTAYQTVLVMHLDAEQMDILLSFLSECSFQYRIESEGGAA